MRGNLISCSALDQREVPDRDQFTLHPLGYAGLRNADAGAELCLPLTNLDSALNGFHRSKISAAYGYKQQRRWWRAPDQFISVPNMESSDRKKAKPTAADLRAAARLKKLWLAMPRDRRPTQDLMAEHWGEGGSQSLISQYMNGNIPLNIRAVMFFVRELGCEAEEIYPDLPGLADVTTLYRQNAALERPDGVNESLVVYDEVHAVDAEWKSFSLEQKQRILELVRLAGVIGITASPKTAVQQPDAALKHSTKAADLRRKRRQQRKHAGGKRSAS